MQTGGRGQLRPPVAVTTVSAGDPGGEAGSGRGCGGPGQTGAGRWHLGAQGRLSAAPLLALRAGGRQTGLPLTL